MGYNVFGHTVGLKPSELKNLERFYRRRVPPASIISHELARELAKVSADLNRQVGLLINRKGEIDYVVVGTFNRIELPELRGYRDHIARLKGLRFIHTHLLTSKITHSELDQDDLIDLALLRLDLVGALEVHPNGEPGKIHIAHIIPDPEFFAGGSLSDKENQFFYFLRPCYVWELKENFLELIKNLEDELERVKPLKEVEEQKDRAILIFLREPNDPYLEERIFELRELARTAGVTVVGEIVQKKPSPDPRYVIGKGKLLEVMVLA
ncbi:MAG TPA: GTPase HflX, partial [Thermodesulfobacterium commune]|nr:GTPase HflX [Thermodesulfobacterium commune]